MARALLSANLPPLHSHLRGLFKLPAISLAGLVLTGWNAAANGFALPDQDAFATARGEAVVATPDNPSAIYYNPAGITQLPGGQLRAGAYLLDYHTRFQPPASAPNAGQTYDEQDNFAAVPRFFYTYSPTNLPLSFGLGIYSPFGGKMSWPQDTGFRSVAISGELKYITINPVVAWRILPSLSIGVGPMINYVDLQTDQGLSRYAVPLQNYFRFSGNGWSAGANVGILWQPMEELSFGATFRSPAKVSLSGQADVEKLLLLGPSSFPADMDLTFPLSVVAGVSWRPTPKWNLEFDANYTDWSSFGDTAIHIANLTSPANLIVQPDNPVKLNWRGSWLYELGVTRYFDHGWRVSAGYCFNENSVPDGYYTPLAADLDRHFFSVGAGWQGKRLGFDVAYQLGYGPEHTVTGSQPSSNPGNVAGQNADGQYGFCSQAVSVSVGWRF